MAAAILEACGVKVKLIAGTNGIFDVVVDGTMIYSKDETGRFPEHHEILSQLT